jgi:hypothetical protein
MALGYINLFNDNDDSDGYGDDDSGNDDSFSCRSDDTLVLYVPS